MAVIGQNDRPRFVNPEDPVSSLKADNSILLKDYVLENLNCPRKAANCCIEGTEIIQFVVTPSGNVKDFNVVNSICLEIDREIIRILKSTDGMWMPAWEDDEPVAKATDVSVMFGNCITGTFEPHFIEEASRYFNRGNQYLFESKKPKKALQQYNNAIRYLPNDKAILEMRGLCHYEMGDMKKAERDWNRVIKFGGPDFSQTTALMEEYEINEMKGYTEMLSFFAENEGN